MNRPAQWKELAEIDEALFNGGSDFTNADRLLDRREAVIRDLAASAGSPEELDELMAHNRRLTEWLLHHRRVALIESVAIDQHLRFIERTSERVPTGGRIVAIG